MGEGSYFKMSLLSVRSNLIAAKGKYLISGRYDHAKTRIPRMEKIWQKKKSHKTFEEAELQLMITMLLSLTLSFCLFTY